MPPKQLKTPNPPGENRFHFLVPFPTLWGDFLYVCASSPRPRVNTHALPNFFKIPVAAYCVSNFPYLLVV